MNTLHKAEHTYDDIVEHCFRLGVWSTDQCENRAFFEPIFEIVLRRINEAVEESRKELNKEWLRILEQKRAEWFRRFKEPSHG